jgi:hypothetical protein
VPPISAGPSCSKAAKKPEFTGAAGPFCLVFLLIHSAPLPVELQATVHPETPLSTTLDHIVLAKGWVSSAFFFSAVEIGRKREMREALRVSRPKLQGVEVTAVVHRRIMLCVHEAGGAALPVAVREYKVTVDNRNHEINKKEANALGI